TDRRGRDPEEESRRSLGRVAVAVLRGAQAVVDLLAHGADRELVRVAARDPHLATQRDDRLSRHRGLHDPLLAHVVRKALVIARLDLRTSLLTLQEVGPSPGIRG